MLIENDVFYVVGNGPSLSTRILAAIPDGHWLGMNSAFRYWHKINKYPRYYACLDPVVLKSQIEGIRQLFSIPQIECFFLHDGIVGLDPILAADPRVTLLSQFLSRKDHVVPFSRLASQKQTTGALATRFVIQRGHKNLSLIGVDCKYVEQVHGAVSTSDIELLFTNNLANNPNYFFADYQATGDRYQVPNPAMHSGNLHLQSFIALRNDLDAADSDIVIQVGSDRSLLSRFGVFPTHSIWSELGIRRIGAVAVPLTPKEWPRQLKNLHLWMNPRLWPSLGTAARSTCLHFFVSGEYDGALLQNIEAGLREVVGLDAFFSTCRITFLEIPTAIDHYIRSAVDSDDPCTKSGPNVLFLATMAQCKEYEYVLHIETDCLPVRAGWLDAAEREIDRAGTQSWVIGPGYFGPSQLQLHSAYRMHINGNAIYQTGDPDYQEFLQGPFLDTLAYLVRDGFRDLAYDTTLSLALYNLGALPEALRSQISLSLPRFSYSNFIRNFGGSRETADPSLIDIDKVFNETDQTFMLHGRPSFHFLDGSKAYLPEFYRTLRVVNEESLPLFHVWSDNDGWSFDLQGYGIVVVSCVDATSAGASLVVFNFLRLRTLTSQRSLCFHLKSKSDFPHFERASFVFQTADKQQTHVDISRTRVERDGTELGLTFELDECPSLSANVVGLCFHGLALGAAELHLCEIAVIERDVATAVPCAMQQAEVVPRSGACSVVINRWHQFYIDLPRFNCPVNQGYLLNWQSTHFRMQNAVLTASRVAITVTCGKLPDTVVTQGALFTAVLGGAPWHDGTGFKLQARISDPEVRGEVVVRLCRNAHSAWEYMDFKLNLCAGFGAESTQQPIFKHQHQSYRFELLSMPVVDGPVTMTLELIVDYPEGQKQGDTLNVSPTGGKQLTKPASDWTGVEPLLIDNLNADSKAIAVEDGSEITETSHATVDKLHVEAGNAAPVVHPVGRVKLLMIDSTPVGHTSATGQLKQTLLGDWPAGDFLQIWETGGQTSSLCSMQIGQSMDSNRFFPLSLDAALEMCRKFDPDVIYFRPVDSDVLFAAAGSIVSALSKPLVIHMMDDWPERLKLSDLKRYQILDGALRHLLGRASQRLSICKAMSDAYRVRYGGEWLPLANGVDVAEFPSKDWTNRPPVSLQSPFVIRYMGALADDMTYSSVREIALAVSNLQSICSVRFEIYTMDWCRPKAENDLGQLLGVSVYPLVDDQHYKHSLAEADALVIAYNFDPKSISYMGLSLANKMPECLASGAPLIAYGPLEVATIRYLKETECAQVVELRDQQLLADAIKALVVDLSYCKRLGKNARTYVVEHLSKELVQNKFKNYLTGLSPWGSGMSASIVGPFARDQFAHYDETDCIAELFREALHGQVMIDVGAHHGWAHAPFLDYGWRIFAFEPDDQNRKALLGRLAKQKNKHLVILDSRCVGNKPQKGVSFFTSGQSTGISGLSAFHETHVEAQKVDITTLTEFFEDKPMPTIDFLKIDTEGHDLFVLQGFPWDRGQPAVIECEFEDTKTVPLGYTFHDLARFLTEKGYTVYVSEWHPIIRYGIRHDWRQLSPYPCELADSKGWGNLLAFREPIDVQALVAAVKKVVKVGAGDTAKPPDRAKLGSGNFDLRTANRLFREGEFSTALQMYLALHEQRPLQIYANNALLAARKQGVGIFTSVDELRRARGG